MTSLTITNLTMVMKTLTVILHIQENYLSKMEIFGLGKSMITRLNASGFFPVRVLLNQKYFLI